jgi:hypothetical protein
MSDDADEEVPVFPEEFVGWRGWRVEKGVLKSINRGEIWTPGTPFEAECQTGKTHKQIPWERCSCGLYSTKTLEKLRSNNYHNAGAFGIVSVWGNMIDGGAGYRSQFAYPRVIYVPFLDWRKVRPLERYGVPVKLGNPWTMTEPEDI